MEGQCVNGAANLPGVVRFASATLEAPPSSTAQLTVRRVGGTSGDITSGSFTSTGDGCDATGGTFRMTAGATSTALAVPLSAIGGSTCVVRLTGFAPAAAGTPLTATITLTPPATVGEFSVLTSASSTTVGGPQITFSVSRDGGSEATSVAFTLAGTLVDGGMLVAGTLSPGSPVAFGSSVDSVALVYQPPAVAPGAVALPASFTLALLARDGGTLGTPASATVTLNAAPLMCPARPAGMLEAMLMGVGNPLLQRQLSGQIVSIPVPAPPSSSSGTTSSISFSFGESAGGAGTPQPVTLELSINRCPGVIDTDPTNFCNLRSTNGSINVVTVLERPYMGFTDYASVNRQGLCWAPLSEGPWFLNARWAYSACAFGEATCGFAIQYNQGPY